MEDYKESPKSSNIRGYYKGYSIQITLRDENEKVFPLLKKMIKIADFMESNNFSPSWNLNTAKQFKDEDPDALTQTGPDWCSIHKITMKRYEKGGKSWYSHMVSEGEWCNGKKK